MMKNTEKTMDKIVALCKGRGFIFSGSEIYGGLANTWDYGPLGVELKNNVKKAWWKKFVQENPYNVGQDSGFFCVEGSSLLWDELYVRRGLDRQDLQSPYCVAEYLACLQHQPAQTARQPGQKVLTSV